MRTIYWQGLVATGVVLTLLALAYCLGGRSPAVYSADEKPRKAGPGGKFYSGAKSCNQAGCHASPPTSDEMYVCTCTEFSRWQKEDKHSQAFEVLKSPRSKQMGQVLWNNPDVTENEKCLSCHAVVFHKAVDGKDKYFTVEEGVTCVLCHGPSQKWVDYHVVPNNRDELRALTPVQKEQQYELNDLWTPSKRATLCASCHVGSIKPGEPHKFVTHDMYAAGHPPLPSFETATFSEQMPRHWKYRQEKQSDLSQKFPGKDKDIAEIIKYLPQGQERTRLALVNAAVVLRESMRLLAEQAERCLAKPASEQALDLATFDCYACHHDLKSTSWRQKRGYAGKPGRPPLPPWPTALIRLTIAESAGDEAETKELTQQLEKKLRQVQSAIEDRPYGNLEKIVPAARELSQWADQLALRLDKKECDAGQARKILRKIPSLFQEKILDYDSARQVAWTFQSIEKEVGEDDMQVRDILKRQDTMLKLRLPSGHDRDIGKELKPGLQILNSYEPELFQQTLAELSQYLRGKPSTSPRP